MGSRRIPPPRSIRVAAVQFVSRFGKPKENRKELTRWIGAAAGTLVVGLFALLASVLNLTGNLCLSRAYQTADASWLAPMDFSYLVFAALWSRVIFDQWPSAQAIAGMALIGAAGVITAWRERIAASGKSTPV